MDSSTDPFPHTIIFVLGPPRSGKGTLCKLAINSLQNSSHRWLHLSVGDFLRKLCDPAALEALGGEEIIDLAKIREHMRENKLLPADVLIPLLKRKISSLDACDQSANNTLWLIDGFPRNMETALVFEHEIAKPIKVITLDCKRAIAENRFIGRRREDTDDKNRFEWRYEEYVQNMKAIREHYDGILETVQVGGSREEGLDGFLAILRQLGDDFQLPAEEAAQEHQVFMS
ncbi:P-loop containing nucleoside triphosphate hydrolase protein [Astrocystis sublimbata]|nr:P-loop containing nucleoside triphosphate hydrolase protein [Astrocystis sublimbata]